MYDLKEGAEYVVNLRENMRTSEPATGGGSDFPSDPPTEADDAFGSLHMAVTCGDVGRWSPNVEQYRREAESARKKEPLIGDLVTKLQQAKKRSVLLFVERQGDPRFAALRLTK